MGDDHQNAFKVENGAKNDNNNVIAAKAEEGVVKKEEVIEKVMK